MPNAFASSAQIIELERLIVYVLNASGTWDGPIDDKRRSAESVTQSRIGATMELYDAIASNPQHGFWGVLATDVDVDHNDLLPEHLGQVGIPMIYTHEDAEDPVEGVPADPDEIDSWRSDTLGLHSKLCGEIVAHDAVDDNEMPSPLAGYYSLVNSRIKFTGYACEIPMVQITVAQVETKTPVPFMHTIAKLAPLYHFKEGDNLPATANALIQAGRQDLERIRAGAMNVSPVSDIVPVQKAL